MNEDQWCVSLFIFRSAFVCKFRSFNYPRRWMNAVMTTRIRRKSWLTTAFQWDELQSASGGVMSSATLLTSRAIFDYFWSFFVIFCMFCPILFHFVCSLLFILYTRSCLHIRQPIIVGISSIKCHSISDYFWLMKWILNYSLSTNGLANCEPRPTHFFGLE